MIKKGILILVITFLAALSYSEKYSLTLWGGMNSLSMSEINAVFEEYGNLESEQITSGGQGALEFAIGENSKLSPVFRISSIYGNKGKFLGEGNFEGEDDNIYSIGIGGEFVPSLNSIEIGIKFPWIEYGKYKNSIGAFVGYGMASVAAKTGVFIGTADASLIVYQEDTYKGSAITFSITDYNEIELSQRLSLGLILGYNLAKVGEIKDSDGNAVETFDGDKIAIDYSGFVYALSLKYKF